MPAFKTNVVTGPALLALSENVRGWQKRDFIDSAALLSDIYAALRSCSST